MKRIKAVIGANFGDEGKGLMTDYFCNKLAEDGPVLNIRFNGGAQAGHTVVAPGGKRHIFSHFGAGQFNERTDAYLSPFFHSESHPLRKGTSATGFFRRRSKGFHR